MTESQEPHRRLSDEELAYLRHVEFGELPGRVPPEDRVELIETEPRRDMPEPGPTMTA